MHRPVSGAATPERNHVQKLRTLGGLELVGSDFRRPKPLLLLAYLALEGPQDRRHLAELFWPSAAAHLKSLSVALAQLRQGAPQTIETVRNRLEARVTLDIAAFAAALKAGDLAAALELYRGPFLDELYLSPYGEELEEWVYRTREGLAERARQAMLTLAEASAGAGDPVGASVRAAAAYRLKGASPPTPEVLGRLHRLLLAGGSDLAREVQDEAADFGVALEPSVEAARAALHRATSQSHLRGTPPTYSTQFIGRLQEVGDLERLLLSEPTCRLLTLVGPGGMGKTRLASEVVRRVAHAFPNAAYFVPLASARTLSELLSALAEALEFRFYSEVPPAQQLFDFLRGKTLLLLLDNFEQLGEQRGFITDLTLNAPDVKLLVTTRESLHLQEEWVYPLEGLSFPLAPDAAQHGETYDAVRLFEACARRATARFSPEAQQPTIAHLCRLVEGLPLALELAAAWLRVMPLQTLVRNLETDLDLLATRQHTFEPRHRSLRTVLEGSWALLNGEERALLQGLAVFRGGFGRAAAEAVAGATLPRLASLVDKSLLKVGGAGRYSLHELLRQFASEKLATDPEAYETARRRHAHYFRAFLLAQAERLTGAGQGRALDEVAAEFDNIRAFWTHALERQDATSVAATLESIFVFCQIRSRYLEGETLFDEAREGLQPVSDSALNLRLLARRGAFRYALCAFDEAERDAQQALQEARTLGLGRDIAFCLTVLGQLAAWQGQRELAEQRLEESATRYGALGDKNGAAEALENLANLLYATFGAYDTSKLLAAQSLSLSRELQRPDWIAYALDTLGFATFCLGEYDTSERHYRESLKRFGESGDRYGLAMATGGVALVLWAVGGAKTSEAASYFERSLHLCEEIGHEGQVAGRLVGLARVANDLGRYAEAQTYAERGLGLATARNSPVYLAHVLCCLGETAYRTGQFENAQRHLTRALQVSSRAQLLPYLAMTLYHTAALYLQVSTASSDALRLREKALELASLVERHGAGWHVYRARAGRLSAELEALLPAEVATMARARYDTASLEALSADLSREP